MIASTKTPGGLCFRIKRESDLIDHPRKILNYLTLGASNKKLPWVEKQKNPEINFKLRSMFLFVRPCTVGRKPRECHRVRRECMSPNPAK